MAETREIAIQTPERAFMTFSEGAIYLGLSKNWLYKLTSKRAIPYYKPGGRKIYFAKSDLDQWTQRNRVCSKEEIDKKTDTVIRKMNL